MQKQFMLKLVRNKEGGRGFRAPALLAFPSRLVQRLGQASRGYVLAGGGVIAAAVVFVSLLSWLAPDSDRPIGSSPLEAIERVAGGVLNQLDEQATALLVGTGGESVLQSVREGVVAAGSRIPWAGERLREISADRSASTSPAAPASTAVRPSPNAAAPAQEIASSPTKNEPAPQEATREPSPPSSTSETPPPPAAEEPPPTTSEPATSEPTSPPPAAEMPPPTTGEPTTPPVTETPPPDTEEPSDPPTEEPPLEEPPLEEPSTPPAEEPPPATDEPATPATEEPPPTPDQPPPATDKPPPPESPPPPPIGPTEDV